MALKKKNLDPEAYGQAFDFLIGFFMFPFFFFTVVTTANIVLHPKTIGDGTALVYIAMLTGVYAVMRKDKNSVLYLGEETEGRHPNAYKAGVALFAIATLVVFILHSDFTAEHFLKF